MKPKQVHDGFCMHRPEFSSFGNKNFASRLRSIREKLKERNHRAARDAAALSRDRCIYTRPHQDGHGFSYHAGRTEMHTFCWSRMSIRNCTPGWLRHSCGCLDQSTLISSPLMHSSNMSIKRQRLESFTPVVRTKQMTRHPIGRLKTCQGKPKHVHATNTI